jgi:hypothetical protein
MLNVLMLFKICKILPEDGFFEPKHVAWGDKYKNVVISTLAKKCTQQIFNKIQIINYNL